MDAPTRPRSQRYADLALAFQPPRPETSRELARAYTRLFLGPGRPIAYPYESAHREGQLMGETTAQVAQHYQQAGFQPQATGPDLPDHIASELAFMAHLAIQEEQDPSLAPASRQHQRLFLREHMLPWIPNLCKKIESGEVHPTYKQIAQATLSLLESDLLLLDSGDRRQAEESSPSSPQKVPSESRSPCSKSPRRVPNMQMHVDGRRCTMCTLCIDHCGLSALKVESAWRELTLVFERSLCNGCRACLRMCPEGAITLEKGIPLYEENSHPPLLVAASARVICPQCQRPHIATAWLERLSIVLGDNPSFRRSLSLCPMCKGLDRGGSGFPNPSSQEWSARA